MRYDDLAGLSPVVRKEVLTGELSRRVKSTGLVSSNDLESIVDSLVSLSLTDVMQVIEDPENLKEKVVSLQNTLRLPGSSKRSSPEKSRSKSKSTSPAPSASAASQDSRLLDPNALNATASAPEHPSTPISISPSLSTPPRTSSPSGSVPPTSERDRLLAAINKFESTRQVELLGLLMSLPKRERAMCLFNAEVLRSKLADAKNVLDSEEDDGEEREGDNGERRPVAVPVTPQAKKTQVLQDSPQTPDLSSRGPSATASPVPGTPGGAGVGISTHTIATLARLPAVEILRLARSPTASTGLPLPKEDPLVVSATDEFIDGLMLKPDQLRKQQLGDKLYVTLFYC